MRGDEMRWKRDIPSILPMQRQSGLSISFKLHYQQSIVVVVVVVVEQFVGWIRKVTESGEKLKQQPVRTGGRAGPKCLQARTFILGGRTGPKGLSTPSYTVRGIFHMHVHRQGLYINPLSEVHCQLPIALCESSPVFFLAISPGLTSLERRRLTEQAAYRN